MKLLKWINIVCFVLVCYLIAQFIPTSVIVKELAKREGVQAIEVAPDVDYIVDTGDRVGAYDFGPATILVLEGESHE